LLYVVQNRESQSIEKPDLRHKYMLNVISIAGKFDSGLALETSLVSPGINGQLLY